MIGLLNCFLISCLRCRSLCLTFAPDVLQRDFRSLNIADPIVSLIWSLILMKYEYNCNDRIWGKYLAKLSPKFQLTRIDRDRIAYRSSKVEHAASA